MIDINTLHEMLKEEEEGAQKYRDLSKLAEWPQDAQILRDIGNEEHSHAKLIRHILEEHGALTEEEPEIIA